MANTQDLQGLSADELKDIIENAERALRAKKDSKRKEVIMQIKELAASIDAIVEIRDSERKASMRKGVKVAPKYQNPRNPAQQWTGRGVAPKWFQELLASGTDKADLLI